MFKNLREHFGPLQVVASFLKVLNVFLVTFEQGVFWVQGEVLDVCFPLVAVPEQDYSRVLCLHGLAVLCVGVFFLFFEPKRDRVEVYGV